MVQAAGHPGETGFGETGLSYGFSGFPVYAGIAVLAVAMARTAARLDRNPGWITRIVSKFDRLAFSFDLNG